MVKISWKTPTKMDDLGGNTPIFGNTQMDVGSEKITNPKTKSYLRSQKPTNPCEALDMDITHNLESCVRTRIICVLRLGRC